MKKRVRIAALIMVFVLSANVAAGCSAKENHEDIIKKSIIEELDSVKNMDEKFLNECVEAAGADELEAFGVEPKEFVKVYLEDFDYMLGDIIVEGEKATVKVTLKCKDFIAYGKELEKAVAEMFSDSGKEKLAGMSEEDLREKLSTLILDSMANLETKETEPIQVDYELIDDKWVSTLESEQRITNVLFPE
ncbi:MAG: hypothetical protein K2O96_06900 [Lachnospiraceae bacterium]|nr:hypothetical protein [Lachnospiraceae bacterium]